MCLICDFGFVFNLHRWWLQRWAPETQVASLIVEQWRVLKFKANHRIYFWTELQALLVHRPNLDSGATWLKRHLTNPLFPLQYEFICIVQYKERKHFEQEENLRQKQAQNRFGWKERKRGETRGGGEKRARPGTCVLLDSITVSLVIIMTIIIALLTWSQRYLQNGDREEIH